MELILNDFSIDGQFATIDEFETYFIQQLNPVMQVIIEQNIPFYKRMDTFSRLLTDKISIANYIQTANNPVSTMIKKNLINTTYSEPYWDEKEQMRSDDKADYEYPGEYEEPNCFTEVIERNESLVSFPSDKFRKKEIHCKRNGEERNVANICNVIDLYDFYLKDDKTNIRYVFEHYPFEKGVKFACINGTCYTEDALCSQEILMEDVIKIFNNIPMLIRDKASGSKTHWWDTIESGIFEYRVSISSNREFRILFLWEEEIVFMNGFIKKSVKTLESEKKKARMIKKNIDEVL